MVQFDLSRSLKYHEETAVAVTWLLYSWNLFCFRLHCFVGIVYLPQSLGFRCLLERFLDHIIDFVIVHTVTGPATVIILRTSETRHQHRVLFALLVDSCLQAYNLCINVGHNITAN